MQTLLRAEYGSRAFGTHTVDSDRDMVEIVIEPEKYITGIETFKTVASSTAAEGKRSTSVDTDTTVYGLQNFCDLAVAGNPTILSILFVSEYETLDDLAKRLVDNRSLFVSKAAGRRFLGYMTSQRDAMLGLRNKRTNRPELVHRFGFDTKFGYHVARLGLLGIELMETGVMQLPMKQSHIDVCMAIRNGEYSKEEVMTLFSELETKLLHALETSTLQERGNRDAVSALLHSIYTDEWASR